MPGNWRGIALMQHVAKLFNSIILRRLRSSIDAFLVCSQNGFRVGRCIQQHISALKLLIDEAITFPSKKLHIIFIDFAKAFDSVSWKSLISVLQGWNVPQNLITSIMSLYSGHKMRVDVDSTLRDVDSTLSEEIAVHQGVLQGDTLAPYLFVVVVDVLLRLLPKRAKDVVLAYADDIALVSDDLKAAESLLHSIEQNAARVGLKLNMGPEKTARFVFNDEQTQMLTLSQQVVPTKKTKTKDHRTREGRKEETNEYVTPF